VFGVFSSMRRTGAVWLNKRWSFLFCFSFLGLKNPTISYSSACSGFIILSEELGELQVVDWGSVFFIPMEWFFLFDFFLQHGEGTKRGAFFFLSFALSQAV
jgi:hypothetical protein